MEEYLRAARTPSEDGFHMPGEYEPHRGCVMIWPVRPGSWPHGAREAQEAFARVARAIAASERVWILAGPDQAGAVRERFAGNAAVTVLPIPTDDAWARDVGPTCVVNGAGETAGIDWQFNAWGGTYDGLYADWDQDDAAARRICEALGLPCYDARPFVLEGGSVHADGEGTLLVTEACLLSPGRNPGMTKEEIGERLCAYLGAGKVIWLPRGIYGDETNEHVDNVCAFVRPGEVVLAWTDDENDPQWELSRADLEVLCSERDARGRRLCVHKLPIPRRPVRVTREELAGLRFAPGEDVREAGERLAASYVNYYVSNGGVIVPQFGDPNDALAVQILGELYPGRRVCPVYARPILIGGGNIHCITQQIPAGVTRPAF